MEDAFLIGMETSDSNHGGGSRVMTPNGIYAITFWHLAYHLQRSS